MKPLDERLAPLNVGLSNQFLADLRLIYSLEAVVKVIPFSPNETVKLFYGLR
jgi:hypothetical protein